MGNIFGDLVDSFTGAGAKRAISEGMDRSAAALREGQGQQVSAINSGIGAIKSGAGEARGYVQPYADQGGRSYGLYNDTLGVNGADARSRAQDLYNSDDMLARQRDLDLKRTNQSLNAGGNYNRSYSTGPQSLADSRVRLQGYGDWQNRLMQNGQMGYSAAGNLAGIAGNEGNALAGQYGNMANVYGGTGQGLANVYGQGYGALAQANNTFAQNLIGAAGTAVRAFNPLGTGSGAGANQIGYQPGTSSNGGWQTSTYGAPKSLFSWG